jgi:hypothetical protein
MNICPLIYGESPAVRTGGGHADTHDLHKCGFVRIPDLLACDFANSHACSIRALRVVNK